MADAAALARRVNYAAIIFLSLAFSVIRRPRALMAVLVCTLALLCLNVPFAASLRYSAAHPAWSVLSRKPPVCCVQQSLTEHSRQPSIQGVVTSAVECLHACLVFAVTASCGCCGS